MTARATTVATLTAVVLVAALVLGASPRAGAHDSHAPQGAAHNWLPPEGWVWQHWLPFDEAVLRRELGVSATTIRKWLRNDHNTLATLARRHGVRSDELLDRLTARWRDRVPAARLRVLRGRASAMLTQGHLAQHVLYHVFHGPGIPTAAPEIFGVTRDEFLAARQAGKTPLEIAADHGRSKEHVRAGILALLGRSAARGVATRSTTRAQADLMLSRQRQQLHCWLTHPLPKLDTTNPYGSGSQHAGHACWENA